MTAFPRLLSRLTVATSPRTVYGQLAFHPLKLALRHIAPALIKNLMPAHDLRRLLVVTPSFYPETFRINEVVEQLATRNIAVTVLTGLPNYPEGRIYDGYRDAWRRSETACGAEIIRVPHLPRGGGDRKSVV